MSTPILGMPELAQSQAIPETTVNEIARILEQGARWFVFLDRDLAAPPGSPADGDAYLVVTGATGAWSGHDGEIAWRMSTAWEFIEPSEGMAAYIADEDVAVTFDGSTWGELGATSLDNLSDVNVAGALTGDALVFNGSVWGAGTPGSSGGPGGVDAGTAFPGSPTTGDQFYRTDRNIRYFYDGTRWLSTELFALNFGAVTQNIAATTADIPRQAMPFTGTYDFYVETVKVRAFIFNAGNWTIACDKVESGGITSLGNTGALSVGATGYVEGTITVNAVVASTAYYVRLGVTENSGTSQISCFPTAHGRLVG